MPDPLEAVWEPVLVPILNRDAAVQAVTLLRHLQVTDPTAFPPATGYAARWSAGSATGVPCAGRTAT